MVESAPLRQRSGSQSSWPPILAVTALLIAGCTLDPSDQASQPTPVEAPTALGTEPTNVPTGSEAGNQTSSNPVDPSPNGGEAALVTNVIDGDTFDISINGTQERVRLIGIDSPETGDCLYAEAARSLRDLLGPGTVELVSDTTDRDQYGRLLRYVWVGDTFINEAQVASGLAVARRYEPDIAQAVRLEAAETESSTAGLGRWAPAACGTPGTNTDGSPSELRIDRIEYDAPGDDSLELNGEWIRIVNDGAAPIQMDGWQLRDASVAHRYRFPVLELEPGDSLTVFSGCGSDTGTELFWCNTRSAVWNNGGDTAYLIDPSGNVATSFTY